MKRRLVHLVCIFILFPILPIFLLRTILQACVDFLDWTVEGRASAALTSHQRGEP